MGIQIDSFKMQTNFDGLIQLLAEGLYSDPDIFLRELIQNAHDSIVRRKEVDYSFAGRIDVNIDSLNHCIMVIDNGIGMDKEDIQDFLCVIGSGFTGAARKAGSESALELIGQFGIGMLSSFVVAHEVHVETLKRGSDTAYGWRNSGSEDCKLLSSDKTDVGSEIRIFIKDTHVYLLDDSKLKSIIVRYCDFISIPIFLNGIGPINTIEAPWNKHFPDAESANRAYYEFINHRFTDGAIDVFPINMDDGSYKARGILYISDRHVVGFNTIGFLDIFIRKMLVKKMIHTCFRRGLNLFEALSTALT